MKSMTTLNQITNKFLWGTLTTPKNKVSGQFIRPLTAAENSGLPFTTQISMSVTEYMEGPGRFARGSQSSMVQQFFERDLLGIDTGNYLYTLAPGIYEKKDLQKRFNNDEYGISFQQFNYLDEKNDIGLRTFLWNSTAIKLSDKVRFVVAEDGTRTIINYSLVPRYNGEINKETGIPQFENFDLNSDSWAAKFGNWLIRDKFDPYSIGRTVNIKFTGIDAVATRTYTFSDFKADQILNNAQSVNSVTGLALAKPQIDAILDDLWGLGISKFLDEKNRPIFYGSDKDDMIGASMVNLSPYNKDYLKNGIVLIGGKGNDTLSGDKYNDRLLGGEGNDKLYGRIGNDTLEGGDGDDLLDGGRDQDMLRGGKGTDTLHGGAGGDRLYGEEGDDTLNGGNDNDILSGGAGADKLNGDAGVDAVSYFTSQSAVTVDLNLTVQKGGDAQGDIFTSIERIIASKYNDSLIGGKGNDTLEGGNGNDRLITQLVSPSINPVVDATPRPDIQEGAFDVLDGGKGSDNYEINSNYGYYFRIVDYKEILIGYIQYFWFNIPQYKYEEVYTADTAFLHSSVIIKDEDGLGKIIWNGQQLTGTDQVIKYDFLGDQGGKQRSAKVKAEMVGSDLHIHVPNFYYAVNDEFNKASPQTWRQYYKSYEIDPLVGGKLGSRILPAVPKEFLDLPVGTIVVKDYKNGDLGFAFSAAPVATRLAASSIALMADDSSAETIAGDSGNNSLKGGDGDDVISGGLGNDDLWGGAGSDKLCFTETLNDKTNVDFIRDFEKGTDQLWLANAVFSNLGATVDASELRFGATAIDANDYLIYDASQGKLYYDGDGNAASGQTLFAQFEPETILQASDFMII
jgi:Ca2+-binding RTX toxin-like protein